MNMPQHYLLVDFHFKDGTILENCHVLDETTGYPFKDIDFFVIDESIKRVSCSGLNACFGNSV